MLDIEARRVSKLNRLLRQRKRAGNQRLRRDDGGSRCDGDERKERPRWSEQEERLPGSLSVQQQQRTLAEVVQQQRRQHENEPRQADGRLAEVPHIRVESFASSHCQEDGTEN